MVIEEVNWTLGLPITFAKTRAQNLENKSYEYECLADSFDKKELQFASCIGLVENDNELSDQLCELFNEKALQCKAAVTLLETLIEKYDCADLNYIPYFELLNVVDRTNMRLVDNELNVYPVDDLLLRNEIDEAITESARGWYEDPDELRKQQPGGGDKYDEG